MRSLATLVLGLILATPATAQVGNGRFPASVADQHRFAIESLRIQSEQRTIEARQQSLDARLTRIELQSRRQSMPITSDPAVTALTLDQARLARGAATARREAIVERVTRIDDWLDRPHN